MGEQRRGGRLRRVAWLTAAAAALGLAAAAGAEPPFAGPGGPGMHRGMHHHGPGHRGMHGPERFLDRHAERLGVDAETRAAIQEIVDASAADGERLRAEHEAARDVLHQLLEADEPDRDAVMAQIERLGAIHVAERQHRMDTMLRIRALLTPEQRREMVEIREEFKYHRGGRKGCGGGPGPGACEGGAERECLHGDGKHDCPYGKHECPQGKHDCPYGKHECPQGEHDCPYGKHECPQGEHECPYGDAGACRDESG